MAWLYLVLAGLCEVVWAVLLKLSQGFTQLGYAVATVLGMIASFLLLAQATRQLPLAVAYPVWTGIGAVGTVIFGVIFFGDRLSPLTWLFVGLLLVSIIGIKVTSAS